VALHHRAICGRQTDCKAKSAPFPLAASVPLVGRNHPETTGELWLDSTSAFWRQEVLGENSLAVRVRAPSVLTVLDVRKVHDQFWVVFAMSQPSSWPRLKGPGAASGTNENAISGEISSE